MANKTGRYVMRNGRLTRARVGEIRKADTALMTSVTFGRNKGERKEELVRLKKNDIDAVGYDKGGALQFRGGLRTQKKLCKFYGDGKHALDVS